MALYAGLCLPADSTPRQAPRGRLICARGKPKESRRESHESELRCRKLREQGKRSVPALRVAKDVSDCSASMSSYTGKRCGAPCAARDRRVLVSLLLQPPPIWQGPKGEWGPSLWDTRCMPQPVGPSRVRDARWLTIHFFLGWCGRERSKGARVKVEWSTAAGTAENNISAHARE